MTTIRITCTVSLMGTPKKMVQTGIHLQKRRNPAMSRRQRPCL
uniref:Uncharacterized protein n=1 Tax=Klebsiella pneumoniae TaxID=573 RepID=A0A8B0STK5_KLEPN|nr:hypothetical protein [Klebsiella pneumoniae]